MKLENYSATIKKSVLLSFIVLFEVSCNKKVDYYQIPSFTPKNTVNAVIEIPAGTNKKYEYNTITKTFEIDKTKGKDRVIQYLPYLGNYGFIPSTYSNPKKGGDGDPIDVLVLSENVAKGLVVDVTPIAVLKLLDDGELDFKIIAIPADTTKQIIKTTTYDEFSKLFPEVQQMIGLWFLNYNKDDVAIIEGWGDEKDAMNEIINNTNKVGN